MKITFLGTGTSQGVPVISCKCNVCTSEDSRDKRLRVSILVETKTETFTIDCGPDFRYQMLRANVQDLDAIVFTHEHKDHVAGLDDIRPFNYLMNKHIDIYAVPRVQAALHREFAYIFADSGYFGLPKVKLHNIDSEPFYVGHTKLIPIEVMHHLMPVLGYRIGDFTYITDAKTISESSIERIKGTKILVVNALQRREHLSHFTLAEAVEFAEKIGAEKTYFTHLSHHMGLHKDVSEELPDGLFVAYDGMEIII